jgi:hypothetical protein
VRLPLYFKYLSIPCAFVSRGPPSIAPSSSHPRAVDSHPFRDNSLFATYAHLTPGTKHEEVEAIILAEYERLKKDGVTPDEVKRTQAQIKAEVRT